MCYAKQWFLVHRKKSLSRKKANLFDKATEIMGTKHDVHDEDIHFGSFVQFRGVHVIIALYRAAQIYSSLSSDRAVFRTHYLAMYVHKLVCIYWLRIRSLYNYYKTLHHMGSLIRRIIQRTTKSPDTPAFGFGCFWTRCDDGQDT